MPNLLHCKEKIENLTAVIALENQLLRSGTFEELEETIQAKLSGTIDLETSMQGLTDPERKELGTLLQKLNTLSQENGLLLKSIVNGAEAARNRLDNVRKQEAQIGAYGQNGQSLYLSGSGLLAQKTV